MENKKQDLTIRISQWITKYSILPATIFTQFQVNAIHREFNRFWGLENALPSLKQPSRFSTFTLGTPLNLWAYYFPTVGEMQAIRSHYLLEPIQVKTEDGITLCGMHFKDPRSLHHPAARTLIVFGGNGELYKIGASAWIIKLLKDSPLPFNIVMFDHRECGYSQGTAHAKGLLLDGEALYQYVVHTLHVSEDHIDLCGFSLGAAIATLVKAQHPGTGGALISNRSFQSLDHAVKGIFARLYRPLSKLFGRLASQLRHHGGWDLNPLEAWKTISSPKMVICHPEDPIISHCASLEQGLLDENLLSHCHHIHLREKNPELPIKNHHVQPLSFYNDQYGRDAEKEILKFLLHPLQHTCYACSENSVI